MVIFARGREILTNFAMRMPLASANLHGTPALPAGPAVTRPKAALRFFAYFGCFFSKNGDVFLETTTTTTTIY